MSSLGRDPKTERLVLLDDSGSFSDARFALQLCAVRAPHADDAVLEAQAEAAFVHGVGRAVVGVRLGLGRLNVQLNVFGPSKSPWPA